MPNSIAVLRPPTYGLQPPTFFNQVGSVLGLVTQADIPSQIQYVQQAWSRVHADVAVPGGIDIGDMPKTTDGLQRIVGRMIPQVRGALDRRALQILSEPVTKKVVAREGIDWEQIGEAMRYDIISQAPAMALINSAVMVGAREDAKKSMKIRALIPAPLTMLALGLVMTGYSLLTGDKIGFDNSGYAAAFFAVLSFVITALSLNKAKTADWIASSRMFERILLRIREMTKENERIDL